MLKADTEAIAPTRNRLLQRVLPYSHFLDIGIALIHPVDFRAPFEPREPELEFGAYVLTFFPFIGPLCRGASGEEIPFEFIW